MSERGSRVARGIKSFVENPVTNLVKGLLLVVIGISDASRTIQDDATRGHVRLGHGLILIGLFSILAVLPNLIEGLDAGARYLELRGQKERTMKEADGA